MPDASEFDAAWRGRGVPRGEVLPQGALPLSSRSFFACHSPTDVARIDCTERPYPPQNASNRLKLEDGDSHSNRRFELTFPTPAGVEPTETHA